MATRWRKLLYKYIIEEPNKKDEIYISKRGNNFVTAHCEYNKNHHLEWCITRIKKLEKDEDKKIQYQDKMQRM